MMLTRSPLRAATGTLVSAAFAPEASLFFQMLTGCSGDVLRNQTQLRSPESPTQTEETTSAEDTEQTNRISSSGPYCL